MYWRNEFMPSAKNPDQEHPILLTDMSNNIELLTMIKMDEGFSSTVYKDTHGLNTIGMGFCLDRIEMPVQVAYYWLDWIIDEIYAELTDTDHVDTFLSLNMYRQFAIINMCYQMGVAGVCDPEYGFVNMWAALKDQDYDAAFNHAIDSDWYRDTTNRASRVAMVLKNGDLRGYA